MFFFLNFVSCCNFMTIPKDKENNKLNIEVIRPTSCLSVLTCVKILVPEKTVKNSQYFIDIIKNSQVFT